LNGHAAALELGRETWQDRLVMATRGSNSGMEPAPDLRRERNGSAFVVLAFSSAALALACGGEVSSGSAGSVTGGAGGVSLAAPNGGRANGSSGGTLNLGGVSAGGTTSTGGAPIGGNAMGGVVTGGNATGGAVTGGSATGGVAVVTGGTATGGTATGGTDTGGSATGGTASVPLCDTVDSLPAVGTACATLGESRCDPIGNQCVCARGIWYCNTSCASTYPTEPTPCSDCIRGAACNYPSGASCACINLKWMCIGTSACSASMPAFGDACDGLSGSWCDYPNSNPALHMAAYCQPTPYSSTGSTWAVLQSAVCPATQPAYSLTNTCPGAALCSYGSTRCVCPEAGAPWICGLGIFAPVQTGGAIPYTPCSDPVDVTGPDGRIYNGKVSPDTSIASNADAGDVVKLDFSGVEIDRFDGGCQAIPNINLQVQIFVGAADTSLDASGTLHVHVAPRDGYHASGPYQYANTSSTPGWAVDLAVTKDGQLAATLTGPNVSDRLTMSGRVESCPVGGDGGPVPITIPVNDGGTFTLPCWASGAC
jgi:hypothetical protein